MWESVPDAENRPVTLSDVCAGIIIARLENAGIIGDDDYEVVHGIIHQQIHELLCELGEEE